MKSARSKQLQSLARGRAVANAKHFLKKSPNQVTDKEYVNTKILLSFKTVQDVVQYTGRSKNTILRVQKSQNYLDYKEMVEAEGKARKVKPNISLVKAMANQENTAAAIVRSQGKPVLGGSKTKAESVQDQLVNDLSDQANEIHNVQKDITGQSIRMNRIDNDISRLASRSAFALAMAVASLIFAAALVFMRQ